LSNKGATGFLIAQVEIKQKGEEGGEFLERNGVRGTRHGGES